MHSRRTPSFNTAVLLILTLFVMGTAASLAQTKQSEEVKVIKDNKKQPLLGGNSAGSRIATPQMNPKIGSQRLPLWPYVVKQPPQIRVSIEGSRVPGIYNPAWVAATASLIVRARAAEKMPPRSVMGHPVVGRRGIGNYAWHDFLFDRVQVIWKDADVPQPGRAIRVRVYNAETPEVAFSLEDEPDFAPGEDYILCLREVDGLAFNAGPEHWRATCGTFGAFQIVGDGVKRKQVDTEPFMTVNHLLEKLETGYRNTTEIEKMRRIRGKSPKGIRF